MKQLALVAALLVMIATHARGQDISGTWQTEKPRYVMTITGSAKAGYSGEWFNLGDMDGMLNGNPLLVSRNANGFTLNPIRTSGTFNGTLSVDGKTISGDWGAHDPGLLIFVRSMPRSAHPIDPSPL